MTLYDFSQWRLRDVVVRVVAARSTCCATMRPLTYL